MSCEVVSIIKNKDCEHGTRETNQQAVETFLKELNSERHREVNQVEKEEKREILPDAIICAKVLRPKLLQTRMTRSQKTGKWVAK